MASDQYKSEVSLTQRPAACHRQNRHENHQVRVQRRRSAHPEDKRRWHICGLLLDGVPAFGGGAVRSERRLYPHAEIPV